MTSTTQTSTELVQQLFQAFGRGDVPFILAHIAPDCRWVASGEGIPTTGNHVGPEGVLHFFQTLAQSETVLRFEPREFFTSGDDVVALGYEQCRINRTGRLASTNWAMLFRLRDGKVTYFETFFDTAAYAAAHA